MKKPLLPAKYFLGGHVERHIVTVVIKVGAVRQRFWFWIRCHCIHWVDGVFTLAPAIEYTLVHQEANQRFVEVYLFFS
jgi:hypothetical protein